MVSSAVSPYVPSRFQNIMLSGKALVSTFRVELTIIWMVSVATSVLILAVAAYFNPQAMDNGALAFLTVPHEHCPLCGMSHSLSFMARGEILTAYSWNPGGPFLYIIVALNTFVGGFAGIAKLFKHRLFRKP